MKTKTLLTFAGLSVVAVALFASPHLSAAPRVARVPVLVELFTSEGCSSCPPADNLAARLEKTQPVPGADIVVLAQHVDYWNRLGWRDPYSSAEASARQSAYSRAFKLDSVYTPQAVVNGHAEFVGSDENRMTEAIARAAQQPSATVDVAADGDAVTVHVTNLPKTNGDAQVWLAVTEDNLSSDVPRGENAGRHLQHTGVVRRLQLLGAAKNGATLRAKISAERGWKRENLRLVAFVQDTKSRHVSGVGAASL